MNIAVYLGSSIPKDPAIVETARELGRWIGSHGFTLVYGGSHSGTMGILADGALQENGRVIGVMPRFLVERKRALEHLTQFIEVETMGERKAEMIRLADLFIALPGGPGTIEEISEVISAVRLNLFDKRCVIWNVNGYYDAFLKQYECMVEQGFLLPEEFAKIHFITSLQELENLVN